METPLKGRPDEVLEDLEQIVLEAIERDEIVLFYIGRSVDLDATQENHGSDEIIPLYETESADNAIEVEDSLLKAFYNHPKCENESAHGEGGISLEAVSYVYAAIWYR
ncbi:MAG: hypothetical protein WBG01_06435 [Bacteroidota bacterium]